MMVKKFIDFTTPLTEEQKLRFDALNNKNYNDIFLDEDCPPTTEEESDWHIYLMKKYRTRRISKEIIDNEKSQMNEEQREAYDYMRAKKIYIIEILKEHGGMTYGELKNYLKEHPFEPSKKSA